MIYANGYEVVREIEKQGSFVAAANSLGISAPAVSKQVKSLENRLGILLFNRTTRTVVPTEAGKKLIATLNSSHEEISNLLSQLMLQKEQKMTWHIIKCYNFQLPHLLINFDQKYLTLELEIQFWV